MDSENKQIVLKDDDKNNDSKNTNISKTKVKQIDEVVVIPPKTRKTRKICFFCLTCFCFLLIFIVLGVVILLALFFKFGIHEMISEIQSDFKHGGDDIETNIKLFKDKIDNMTIHNTHLLEKNQELEDKILALKREVFLILEEKTKITEILEEEKKKKKIISEKLKQCRNNNNKFMNYDDFDDDFDDADSYFGENFDHYMNDVLNKVDKAWGNIKNVWEETQEERENIKNMGKEWIKWTYSKGKKGFNDFKEKLESNDGEYQEKVKQFGRKIGKRAGRFGKWVKHKFDL